MHYSKALLVILLSLQLSGCFFTKVVTVPMRVGGAVISVVPVVGDMADTAIDTVADTIDMAPL